MFSKDSDEIDDLFQEILIRLWKGYDTFRAQANVRTWIYRVALNCCLNADKKRRRGGERVPLSVDIDPFEDTDDILSATQKLKRFKLQYQRVFLGSMVAAVILAGLYVPTIYHSWSTPEQGLKMVIAFFILAVVICFLGYLYYKRLMKACDSILDRLKMKEDRRNVKT